ncbi:MAG: hypothetical protein CVT89_00255 [Candidatus Altiarchaeales archaeon HGW-Altiarchaeales-2]|nr:MAG: hypothetical protein CVT89_00255 [Candidatus Altiarchaeales archaeon HGW-Altiarchaeales-2]
MVFAWIPLLTDKLVFENCKEELENEGKGWEKITDKEKITAGDVLLKLNLELKNLQILTLYKKKHCENDIRGSPEYYWNFVFVDNDWKVVYVLFASKKGDIEILDEKDIMALANISYKKNNYDHVNGIIEINLMYLKANDNKRKFEKVMTEVYVCVRDLYHQHTHHDESHELLLCVVNEENEEKNISKILDQYRKKIIKYHKTIKEGIENHPDEKILLNDILLAKGEMRYAMRLIELTNQSVHLKEQFQHSYESFKDFEAHIGKIYEGGRADEMKRLTFVIFILTFLMVIFNIVMSPPQTQPILLGMYFVLVLVVVVIYLYAQRSHGFVKK